MSRRIRLFAAAGLAAAALTTATVTTAPVASATPTGLTALVLTVANGEAGAPIDRIGTLACNPVGGSHPTAASACAALSFVNNEPQMLDADSELACARIYRPVTVSMLGLVSGRMIAYQHTFGNACELRGAMGSLFAF